MASVEEINKLFAQSKEDEKAFNPRRLEDVEDYSDISVLQSMLAGVGSGLIAIPKGFASLGASLMDLGADTNKAAEVEKYFDDLTFKQIAEITDTSEGALKASYHHAVKKIEEFMKGN